MTSLYNPKVAKETVAVELVTQGIADFHLASLDNNANEIKDAEQRMDRAEATADPEFIALAKEKLEVVKNTRHAIVKELARIIEYTVKASSYNNVDIAELVAAVRPFIPENKESAGRFYGAIPKRERAQK